MNPVTDLKTRLNEDGFDQKSVMDLSLTTATSGSLSSVYLTGYYKDPKQRQTVSDMTLANSKQNQREVNATPERSAPSQARPTMGASSRSTKYSRPVSRLSGGDRVEAADF